MYPYSLAAMRALPAGVGRNMTPYLFAVGGVLLLVVLIVLMVADKKRKK